MRAERLVRSCRVLAVVALVALAAVRPLMAQGTSRAALPVAAPVVDTPPAGIITPHYGTGRLWAEPLPESPMEIAKKLTGKTRAELSDSAVKAMVQTYLDAMVAERSPDHNPLPSWTTTVAGKKVGIDPRWIYIGGLKIPTMLLALLPIKVQANPTMAEASAKLKAMTDDLMEAARRSQTLDEFKDAVKDLHQQTERDREFKKNQRTPPPDTSNN